MTITSNYLIIKQTLMSENRENIVPGCFPTDHAFIAEPQRGYRLFYGDFLHPRNVVAEGDTVQVLVLNVDAIKHRLGLGLRQVRTAGLISEMGP